MNDFSQEHYHHHPSLTTHEIQIPHILHRLELTMAKNLCSSTGRTSTTVDSVD
jgi:hypothetical protein